MESARGLWPSTLVPASNAKIAFLISVSGDARRA